MKKLSILAFAFVLTATMFAGCRSNPATTSPSSTTPTKTTAPQTTTLPKGTVTQPSAGILPGVTDPIPESSGIVRGIRAPRY